MRACFFVVIASAKRVAISYLELRLLHFIRNESYQATLAIRFRASFNTSSLVAKDRRT
jgi:hypothetical protein